MKDYTALFKAFVMPYWVVCALSGIVFMIATGQEVPMELWGLLGFPLSEMGIHWSVSKLVTKK